MKKALALLLVLFLSVGLVGCQIEGTAEGVVQSPALQLENTKENNEEVKTPLPEEEIPALDGEVLLDHDTEVDQSALEIIETSNSEKGYKLIKSEISDSYYLAVFAGEKPTTGYEIEINKAEIVNGTLMVTVLALSPGPDTMNATMLTYPTDVVMVKDVKEDMDVEVIFEEAVVEILEGTYTGRIDNSSIEVNVGEEPMALRFTPLSQEQFDSLDLEANDAIFFEVYENSYGQIILKSISHIEG